MNKIFASICLDDCVRTDSYRLLQLVSKYNYSVTFSVPTSYVGKNFEGKEVLSWNELKRISSKGHEVASHSVSHDIYENKWDKMLRVSGNFWKSANKIHFFTRLGNWKESKEHSKRVSIEEEVLLSKKIIEKNVKKAVATFTIPGGVRNVDLVRFAIWNGYDFVRSSDDGVNTVDALAPFNLKIKVWDRYTKASDANSWYEHNGNASWIIEVVHLIGKHPSSTYEAKEEEFAHHLQYLQQQRIIVDTIAENGEEMVKLRSQFIKRHFKDEAENKTWFVGVDKLQLLKKQLNKLPKNSSILDVGCADGANLSSVMRFNTKNFICMGSDISLQKCKSTTKLTGFPTLWVDGSNIPIKDGVFDFIIDDQTSTLTDNDMVFIKEHTRLLKMKGRLLLSLPIKSLLAIYFYRKNGQFVLDSMQNNVYPSKEVVFDLVDRCGFKVVEYNIEPIEYFVLDLIIRFLEQFRIELFKKPEAFASNSLLSRLRNAFKIRIPGFYSIELLLEKTSDIETQKILPEMATLVKLKGARTGNIEKHIANKYRKIYI